MPKRYRTERLIDWSDDDHPGDHGAFLLDPDSNDIGAVYHGPATRSADAMTITRDDA